MFVLVFKLDIMQTKYYINIVISIQYTYNIHSILYAISYECLRYSVLCL